MSKVRLTGATSGYTEITAPAVAGSNTITLPTGNGAADQRLVTNGSGALSFTSNVMLAAGSAGSPSLYFSGDTNTGMWSPAADTLAWSTGGTERMRIISAAALFGRTSLSIPSGMSNANLQVSEGLSANNGVITAVYSVDRVNFNAGVFYVLNASSVGVSLTSGATAWAAQSDERFKTSLVPITNGLSKVSTLRAVTGRYVSDDQDISRSFLIAQDVQAVLPEAVSESDDEDRTLALRYQEVIPLLVAALKESKEQIEALTARVTALEAN